MKTERGGALFLFFESLFFSPKKRCFSRETLPCPLRLHFSQKTKEQNVCRKKGIFYARRRPRICPRPHMTACDTIRRANFVVCAAGHTAGHETGRGTGGGQKVRDTERGKKGRKSRTKNGTIKISKGIKKQPTVSAVFARQIPAPSVLRSARFFSTSARE